MRKTSKKQNKTGTCDLVKGQYYRIVPHILRPWRHVTTATNHWPQRCYIPPPLLQCKQTPAGDVWSHIAITYDVHFCSRDQGLTIGFLQQMWICVTANCTCVLDPFTFLHILQEKAVLGAGLSSRFVVEM